MAEDIPTGWMPGPHDYGLDSLLNHWKKRRADHFITVGSSSSVVVGEAVTLQVVEPANQAGQEEGAPLIAIQEVVLQSVFVEYGGKTDEGMLIKAVTLPFMQIIKEIERDPDVLRRLTPRQFEEIIAGAYRQDGWPEVVLTPASGDRGRDVIATRPEFGQIRIIDQAKRFDPKYKVSANDVRALIGVLYMQQNVTKAIVTTTSTFAPGISDEFKDLIPNRLVLRNGEQVNQWLTRIQNG